MGLTRGLQLARHGYRYLRRMRRGRRAVLDHLASPGPSPVPWPTFVQLRLTNLCNLRCRMCGQWGETGIYRPSGPNGADEDGERERERIRDLIGAGRQLSLADYVRLLDEIAPFDPIVSLFGGEPLLYPDLVPLVREIKARGLALTVITNAGRLESVARDFVEAGLDVISVSVDGPPALHDRIRGSSDSFERLARGVRAVDRWRRELKRAGPMQVAILPITELNLGEIGAAVESLHELPIDAVNIGLRWFIPPSVGTEYERVMRETFGVAAGSWKGFEFEWPGGIEGTRTREMADLVKLLKGIRRRRLLDEMTSGRPWTAFVPDVRAEDVPVWMTDVSRTFGHDFCPVAWYFAQVEPDGDVVFCGDFPDFRLGNVREEPFARIWQGEKARRFREKLAKEPLPVCARCCGSFVFGKWKRPAGG